MKVHWWILEWVWTFHASLYKNKSAKFFWYKINTKLSAIYIIMPHNLVNIFITNQPNKHTTCRKWFALFLCSSWNIGWDGSTHPPLPSLMHSWDSTPAVRSNWARFSPHYHSLNLLHWYSSMLHYTSLAKPDPCNHSVRGWLHFVEM